ncbi:hypothetical protein BJX63DRAFT_398199 [Aspergillus granulosus]|uniref:TRP C-terminal domain-containing protein n=1 Tax=Aspergillus granulosus TaxID=176169 RepID=A0ABR4H8N2_9EURO
MLHTTPFTWSLLLSFAHAAFIRHWPCDLSEEALIESRFDALSLGGSLDHAHGNTSLYVQLTGDFFNDDCEELIGQSAVLAVDARVLGNPVILGNPSRLEGACPTLSPKDNPRYDPRKYAKYKGSFPLDHRYRFSTLDTEIRLRLNDTDIACIHANITPDFGPTLSRSIMGIPLAIMLLSGAVTGAVRTYRKRRSSTFRYELEGNQRDPAELSLPGLGPCLQYVQFVFLTGCLTIPYPGFFRAAVSNLAWSSLIFRNWPVTHQFTYPGVRDGIYTMNATYGLEEMAQYLGSTAISDLWANSLVNLVLVALGVGVVIQLATICRWLWQLYTSHGILRPASFLRTEVLSSLRKTGWSVTRLILDYFLHPLISFSLFLTHNASWFPGHTSMAMIIVAALAGLRVALIRHLIKTNRLILFSPHSFFLGNLGNPALHWGLLCGIPFLRGLAIGGLQQSGLAQAILLTGCEVFILAHVIWNWHVAGSPWRYAIFAFARFAAVSMGCVFLPQVTASERTRAIVAYAILALHAAVLMVGLVVDCVCEPLRYALYKMGLMEAIPRQLDRTKPPVFGIKQLAHRSTRRVSFGRFPALDPDAQAHSPPSAHTRTISIRHVSSAPSLDRISNASFRAPRPQTGSIASLSGAPLSPGSFPRDSNSSGSDQGFDTIELQSLDTDMYTAVNDSEYYAQRESDQYYHWGREAYAAQHEECCVEAPNRPRRVWPWKSRGRREKGFEVIRPVATRPGMAGEVQLVASPRGDKTSEMS